MTLSVNFRITQCLIWLQLFGYNIKVKLKSHRIHASKLGRSFSAHFMFISRILQTSMNISVLVCCLFTRPPYSSLWNVFLCYAKRNEMKWTRNFMFILIISRTFTENKKVWLRICLPFRRWSVNSDRLKTNQIILLQMKKHNAAIDSFYIIWK